MNILVVDDSRSARYALRLQLQKYNVSVDTAETAEAGLEMLNGQKPDAIFMDHMMPGMTGFEALQVIKANPKTAHIPVVMCTSNEDPAYEAKVLEKGALTVLPKSEAGDKLARVLQQLSGMLKSAPAPAAVVGTAQPAPQASVQAMESSLRAYIANELKAFRTALQSEIQVLRTDLPEPEINQIRRATERLEHEVLPHLVQQAVAAESKRILDSVEKRVGQRLDEELDALVEKLPEDKRLTGPLLASALAQVETKAMEVARRQAQATGEAAGEERAGRMANDVAHSTEQALKRAYLSAIGSGLVGVGAAILVYLWLR